MVFFLCVFTSQLRAQNQVLKKGVVDEQANSASLKVQWCIFKKESKVLRKQALKWHCKQLCFSYLQTKCDHQVWPVLVAVLPWIMLLSHNDNRMTSCCFKGCDLLACVIHQSHYFLSAIRSSWSRETRVWGSRNRRWTVSVSGTSSWPRGWSCYKRSWLLVKLRAKRGRWTWGERGKCGSGYTAAYIYLFFCSGLKVMVVSQ